MYAWVPVHRCVCPFDCRPAGLPECCIIGKPFHPPPPTFAAALPVKWSEVVMGTVVDWNAV